LFRLSDADVTYRGHKGQGFQAQIMEAFSEDKKKPVLNLTTHVEVEPSLNCDAPTLISPIISVKEQKMTPEKVLAKKLFGNDDNTQKADQLAADIVSPEMMCGADAGGLQVFGLLEIGHYVLTPRAYPGENQKAKKSINIHF
jgi:hypothetical protein